MAMIENGRALMGQTLSFPLESGVIKATVVEPVFYDKAGERQHV
jgi:sarcosine oxidase subunit alpha